MNSHSENFEDYLHRLEALSCEHTTSSFRNYNDPSDRRDAELKALVVVLSYFWGVHRQSGSGESEPCQSHDKLEALNFCIEGLECRDQMKKAVWIKPGLKSVLVHSAGT